MSIDQRAMFAGAAAAGMAMLPNTQLVTVRSIDPDTGATLATATGVTANRSAPRKNETSVGDGVVLSESCRFRMIATGISFTVKTRDQIIEADGTVWGVESADLAVYSSRWVCEVTRHRS